jgi:hypothetical protein
MSFATISNKNGKVVIQASVITTEIKKILSLLKSQESHIDDQDDLIGAIYDIGDSNDFNKEDYCLAAAIYINSMNHCISDTDDLIAELSKMGIEIFNDNKSCFKPVGCGDLMMYFIPQSVLKSPSMSN